MKKRNQKNDEKTTDTLSNIDATLDRLEREMQEEDAEEIRKEYKKYDYRVACILLMVSIGLLYISGWEPMKMALYTNSPTIINSHGFEFAIRINDFYYGLHISNRFFDSPAISWICLGVAISLIIGCIRFIFRDASEE